MRKVAGDAPEEKLPASACRTEPIPEATWRDIEKLLPYPPDNPVSPVRCCGSFSGWGSQHTPMIRS
jgi:hypothetical protein